MAYQSSTICLTTGAAAWRWHRRYARHSLWHNLHNSDVTATPYAAPKPDKRSHPNPELQEEKQFFEIETNWSFWNLVHNFPALSKFQTELMKMTTGTMMRTLKVVRRYNEDKSIKTTLTELLTRLIRFVRWKVKKDECRSLRGW